jgi:hypothetical protein
MRESIIEEYLVHCVKNHAGEIRKLKWIGRDGAPDRVVFLKGVHFVELKATGKTPEPHQEREHIRMRSNGAKVWVIDSLDKVDAFMRSITGWIGYDMSEQPDKTILTNRGEFFPPPTEYPQDYEGVKITLFRDTFIVVHPAHPPYMLRDGKWERINPVPIPTRG